MRERRKAPLPPHIREGRGSPKLVECSGVCRIPNKGAYCGNRRHNRLEWIWYYDGKTLNPKP